MQQKSLLTATILALATTGSLSCLVDRSYEPGLGVGMPAPGAQDVPVRTLPDDDGMDVVGGIRNGFMVGDVGPAVGINQGLDHLAGYDDGFFLSVEAVAQLDERVAMLMFHAFDVPDLFVPGTRRTFAVDDYEDGFAPVYLLGCTGPAMNVYDEFDVAADEVEVVVDADDADAEAGVVQVQFHGRWDSMYDESEVATQFASVTFTLRQ